MSISFEALKKMDLTIGQLQELERQVIEMEVKKDE